MDCWVRESISQQKKATKKRAKADAETAAWRYQTEPMPQVSAQGTIQFKVWQYNKKGFVAKEQAMKNAVHAVIFRGVQSTQRVRGFRALVDSNTQSENSAYFDSFFEKIVYLIKQPILLLKMHILAHYL